MSNKLLGWVGVLVLAALSVYGAVRPAQVVQVSSAPSFGAVTSLDQPCLAFGGVTHCYAHQSISQASTTLCSFPAPTATSTLVFAGITTTTGTTTAVDIEIGKSLSPAATTTTLGIGNFASNALGTLVASTTLGNNVDPSAVFAAPWATSTDATGNLVSGYYNRYYLNFKMGGTQGAANVLTGVCNAEWVLSK